MSGKLQNNSTIVEKFGNLSVKGNSIVDKNGKTVSLHGMSLFWSQIKGKYYNYDCIKWLRDDWNCTVVRAAMGIEEADSLDGYLVHKEREFNKVVTVVDAAIDLGIYVIVDWHDHHAHENKDEAIEFFQKIAEKYGDKPNIIYEIYNEPMQISWADEVKPYSEELIKAIREIDPDNLIIVGTTTWSQDVDIAAMDPLPFSNIVYSLHFYASSHKQNLRNKAKIALENGKALFVSEFGICEYTGSGIIDSVEVAAWFDFMDKNNISWCNWAIGDKIETSAALINGASPKGNWTEKDISISGKMLRDKIKFHNKGLFTTGK
ncbi:MAG: glycoside hydrolase family 5 protein [Calditrichaeota bacterium]|nr:MAG: glycoside hydrolase family 5 protein [Calditrichota bacterium]MBL1206971.1 glycoside hydrolase family 5 protein [Calditrichota bacterium]NOG46798.1 glycoside hydrolase family 5 protein [Calditrichota bacterium]